MLTKKESCHKLSLILIQSVKSGIETQSKMIVAAKSWVLSWAYELKPIWGGTKFLPEKFVTAIEFCPKKFSTHYLR